VAPEPGHGWSDLVLVGRIARSRGLRGELVVESETDFPDERFKPGARLWIQRAGAVDVVTVTSMWVHQGRPVITLEGITTRTEGDELAGLELRVPPDALVPLPPGTFYHHDLVGCTVRTVDGTEVGTVSRVDGAAGGSRLVVTGTFGDVLVPLVEPICVDIDVVGRAIVIDPPDGLLQVNMPEAVRRR
jgi:16S rRNA processing protein RimM